MPTFKTQLRILDKEINTGVELHNALTYLILVCFFLLDSH